MESALAQNGPSVVRGYRANTNHLVLNLIGDKSPSAESVSALIKNIVTCGVAGYADLAMNTLLIIDDTPVPATVVAYNNIHIITTNELIWNHEFSKMIRDKQREFEEAKVAMQEYDDIESDGWYAAAEKVICKRKELELIQNEASFALRSYSPEEYEECWVQAGAISGFAIGDTFIGVRGNGTKMVNIAAWFVSHPRNFQITRDVRSATLEDIVVISRGLPAGLIEKLFRKKFPRAPLKKREKTNKDTIFIAKNDVSVVVSRSCLRKYCKDEFHAGDEHQLRTDLTPKTAEFISIILQTRGAPADKNTLPVLSMDEIEQFMDTMEYLGFSFC